MWIFSAVVLVAVIAVTATISVLVTRGTGSDGVSSNVPTSSIASANDNGPVNIITEEPTCEEWSVIYSNLTTRSKNGWDKRDSTIPGSAWSDDQRRQFQAVGNALKIAADQVIPLAASTPHRVIRELYSQFVAYSRSYNDAIAHYQPADEALSRVWVNASWAIDSVCAAIKYASAGTAALTVRPGTGPVPIAPVGDIANPERFVMADEPFCKKWKAQIDDLSPRIEGWRAIDSSIPSSQWSPAQRASMDEASSAFEASADLIEDIGRSSGNAVLADLSALAAQYRRAYIEAIPTYTSNDAQLANVPTAVSAVVNQACKAAAA
jgi:hypothetical protein